MRRKNDKTRPKARLGLPDLDQSHVVKMHAARLGTPKLAPHDLRWPCARLCHVAGGQLEQIQFLLEHVLGEIGHNQAFVLLFRAG